MPMNTNTNEQLPLRAGYNSLVPDLDKWLQFDRDQVIARELQAANKVGLMTPWHSLLHKLQPKHDHR
jgi:hypothetical protein